jgi:hypothetical protein
VALALPPMMPKQEASWRGLLGVSRIVTSGWCLVGGQMVQLWCWDRGSEPTRPTDDGDAVLDIRARPTIMADFTQALVDCGFEPDGETWHSHQHRWVDGQGQIDILLPEGIGPRARRRGVRGGTTLETPGAQNILDRAEPFEVSIDGQRSTIFRPTLQGALIAKSYAFGVVLDPLRRRHLEDLATLANLVRASDRIGEGLNRKERNKLFVAYDTAMKDPYIRSLAEDGFARLRIALWPNL